MGSLLGCYVLIIKQYLDTSQSVYIEYDSETKEFNINDIVFFMEEPAITRINELIGVIKNESLNITKDGF